MSIIVRCLILTIVIVSSITGCRSGSGSADSLIRSKVARILADWTVAAITAWDQQITQINNSLTQAQTKLGKLEQVGTPAEQWIEYITAKAKQEQWNGRVLQVMSDLNKYRNDQYAVAKLQLEVEMLTAGMRYTGTILIDELATGKVTPYAELRDALKAQVATLSEQREALVKMRNAARLTGIELSKMAPKWTVQKVNSITYTVSGQGLGMATSLTSGTWAYSSNTQDLTPKDAAAASLQKVLTGN